MSEIRCFWIEPTDRASVELRRYVGRPQGACSVNRMGYHDAEVTIADTSVRVVTDERERLHSDFDLPKVENDDSRWPASCVCGYVFTDADERQVNGHTIYRRLDTGEEMTLREAPAGAMWDAWWYGRGAEPPKYPDGIHLMVRCPDARGGSGEWYVDGPASNGPGWTRTGEARSANPTISATPSIGIGEHFEGYHGFLTNGILREC